jgi:septal ring factor EnvC (AmiA/AmiB activator)
MSYNGDNNNSSSSFWGVIFFVIAGAIILNSCSKSKKPYNSDVYSSWEEERIDELESELADQCQKEEESKERMDQLESDLAEVRDKLNLF